MLIVFDDLIADMEYNKEQNPIVNNFFKIKKSNVTLFLYHNLIIKY